MPVRTRLLLFLALVVFASASTIGADEKLTLKVSRPVVTTRESVVVTAIVPQDAHNRMLGIQADSGEFFRSSEVEVDGDRAPRVFELPLHGLPSGEYMVAATLVDDKGERTTVRKTFQVISYGDDR